MRSRITWLVATAAAGSMMVGASVASAGTEPTVHLRGTAYEFDNVHVMLAGATIGVAELPALKATVGADGRYDLVVPSHTRVTPYITAAGHHSIYLQTFATAGENLENVNFQTPSTPIYEALVTLLKVPVDANGDPAACAIVSTFSTRNVRDLDYMAFIAYGAHGVAGATATLTPARAGLPAPTYFNAQVIPDPAQRSSSADGGVVWTGVPAGRYTVTAQHPTARFASFVATCEPGRVVNANPPWGLHELGRSNPVRIAARWSGVGGLRSLVASRLPSRALVSVNCTGIGCPFATRTIRVPSGSRTLDVGKRLGAGGRRLRPGQTLSITVSAHTYDATVVRWKLRATAPPRAVRLCAPLGTTALHKSC